MSKYVLIGGAGVILIGLFGVIYLRSSQKTSMTNVQGETTQSNTNTPSPSEPTAAQSSATPIGSVPSSPGGPPLMQIDPNKSYTAVLTTGAGVIEISLNASKTPITVNNFVALAKNKFYDNTIFHRIINGFMIQGGDPKGDGTGGPGYKFADEPFEGQYRRGTVAMANAGPNTNGSQFFIMHADYQLPHSYVIFGQVSKGLEVVDAIASAPVKANASGEQSTPAAPTKVTSVVIREE